MAFNAYQQPYQYQYGNQNYNNIPSYGGYNQQYIQQQPQYQNNAQQYQAQTVQQYQTVQPQQPMIYGKVVESAEIAKNQEIPIGSTYVFPQADLSAIYLKSWNSDGSTKVITYSPVSPEETKSQPKNEYAELLSNIQMKIDELDKKISTLV